MTAFAPILQPKDVAKFLCDRVHRDGVGGFPVEQNCPVCQQNSDRNDAYGFTQRHLARGAQWQDRRTGTAQDEIELC